MEQEKPKSTSPGRNLDTLLRVTLRNQVDHIAIADSKANMIININTILISLIIAVLGSGIGFGGTSFIQQKMLVIPFIILMVSCLLSTIFAVLSARPKMSPVDPNGGGDGNASMTYFGMIGKLDKEEFMKRMNRIMASKQEIQVNLLTDIYFQGKILNRKYGMVRNAFTLFITGLSACVLAFLVLWISNYAS